RLLQMLAGLVEALLGMEVGPDTPMGQRQNVFVVHLPGQGHRFAMVRVSRLDADLEVRGPQVVEEGRLQRALAEPAAQRDALLGQVADEWIVASTEGGDTV